MSDKIKSHSIQKNTTGNEMRRGWIFEDFMRMQKFATIDSEKETFGCLVK